jgi:hypothetical protein
MDPKLDFALHALAVYRLASMVTKEAGPWWMFRKLRRKVKQTAPKVTHMDEGIDCLLCMSMQIGVAVAIAHAFLAAWPPYQIVVWALALSAAAVLLNRALPPKQAG